MFVPQGLLVILLCDDVTGERVDEVLQQFQLIQRVCDSVLLMTSNKLFNISAQQLLSKENGQFPQIQVP